MSVCQFVQPYVYRKLELVFYAAVENAIGPELKDILEYDI